MTLAGDRLDLMNMQQSKEKLQKEGFESICLFLGHIIIADGNVDIQESILLNTFITINGLDPRLKNELFKIFTQDKEQITLDAVLERLQKHSPEVQEQALIAGLIMAYGDGDYHEKEDRIFKEFLQATNFDSARFEILKASASNQPSITSSKEGLSDF
jgi:tellurite resistance protein